MHDTADPGRLFAGSPQTSRAGPGLPAWRIWLSGFLTVPALMALILGAGRYVPPLPAIDPILRMTESLAPHLLVLALILALAIAGLGARVSGLVLAVAALAVSGVLARDHLSRSLPVTGGTADLRILWFNMLRINDTPPDRLIAALAESGADIVILAEGNPLQSHLVELAETFPYQSGCRKGQRCELIVLSRQPMQGAVFRNYDPSRPERLAVLDLGLPQGPMRIVAAHLVKPWYEDVAPTDEWYLSDTVDRAGVPLLLVGDFNAAPWSRRMARLHEETGIMGARLPVATWPVALKGAGVPIDQALVRGGARLTEVEPWGLGLNSNHRGLMIGVALPDGGAS